VFHPQGGKNECEQRTAVESIKQPIFQQVKTSRPRTKLVGGSTCSILHNAAMSNHVKKKAFSPDYQLGDSTAPGSELGGTGVRMAIYQREGTKAMMDVSLFFPLPLLPHSTAIGRLTASLVGPILHFRKWMAEGGWQSKGAIVFGASRRLSYSVRLSRPVRVHGLKGIPCRLSPIGNADTVQRLPVPSRREGPMARRIQQAIGAFITSVSLSTGLGG
jgi:hypothetical protein